MRKISLFAWCVGAALPLALFAGCSSDKATNDGETGATGGEDSSTSGKTSGGTSNAGKTGATEGGTGNDAPVGGDENMGGTGNVASGDCDLSGEGKDRVEVPNPVNFDLTLTADKVWVIKGYTYVTEGATLTVDACTRVEGDSSEVSALIVANTGRLVAEGTENSPILFTSEKAVGKRKAGDWGGVALMGLAPVNTREGVTRPNLDGLPDAEENKYGGDDPEDDSGSLKYVRIEYAGYAPSDGYELNGLTLGGVGSKTTLSHIEVNAGLDDCFEWFGGTVNADHLICNTDGDDMFDMDGGFSGTVTEIFGRKRANPSSDPTGFEWDNNKTADNRKPVTNPTIHNATFCGFGFDVGVTTYAAVLRRGTAGTIDNLVATGFTFGIDVRNVPQSPGLTLTHSTFFGNINADVVDPLDCDDVNAAPDAQGMVTTCGGLVGIGDHGFNEQKFFDGQDPYTSNTGNTTESPGWTVEDCQADSGPNAKVTGSKTGAFKDGNWLKGLWIDWADK